MENNTPAIKKSKKKRKKIRNPPPPLFNSDTSSFNPMNDLSNRAMFPGNLLDPPSNPMNVNEIFNRFDQLLDWNLPFNKQDASQPIGGPKVENTDVDDRNLSPIFHPPDEKYPDQNKEYALKRKSLDANDLRNHLDHQNKIRKDIDDRLVDEGDHKPDPFDGSRTRFDRYDIDDRRDPWDCSGGQTKNLLPERFDEAGPSKIDNRLNCIPNDRDLQVFDYLKHPNRKVADSSDVRSNERFMIHDRDDRWPVDINYNPFYRRSDAHQDVGRKARGNWPMMDLRDKIEHRSDRYSRGYSGNRGEPNTAFYDEYNREDFFNYGNARDPSNFPGLDYGTLEQYRSRMSGYDEDRYRRMDPRGSNIHQYFRYGRTRDDHFNDNAESYRSRQWIREDEDCYPRLDPRNAIYHNAREEERYRFDHDVQGRSYDRAGNPIRREGFASQDRQDPYANDTNFNDFMVIIYKPGFSRITFKEAEQLRTLLVELVMFHGDKEHTPEFISSGLMRNGKGFYVKCRTMETMNWLLNQKLPHLGHYQLLMRKNRIYETIKISSFAPKCNRTREEVFKLIRLQNAKKGFNFDNWSMRSYSLNPQGVYMAFDIGLDEVPILYEHKCQLSFELLSLNFKISLNSVQTVADFSV